MIREGRPRRSSAGCRRAIRPWPRSGCSRCRHRVCAEARLGVRARTAGLTAVGVDRALTDERSLAVMWLNRGTPQQKQKARKRLAKAKGGRRQRGAAASEPAPDPELHPSAGLHRPHPRAARVSARPGASRSHRSVVRTHLRRRPARRRVGNAPQRKDHVPTWLWIVIIIVVALAILGYFGRGRFSR
jgi:cobalamin biosynthesis Mg chelatase CobN